MGAGELFDATRLTIRPMAIGYAMRLGTAVVSDVYQFN
jgi:hypothetical protein